MVHTDEKNCETISFTDASKLCEDVSSLYLNEEFSDVTLKLDGQKLFAHKVILSIRSDFFKTLLHQDSQGSSQNEITITDAAPEVFKSLLKYIYTGSITIPTDAELISQVLELAHRYSLKHLEKGIAEKIKPFLNIENVFSLLNTATLYEMEELKHDCLSFMDNTSSEVLASDCFKNLSQKSVIKLLERNTFFASEIKIFHSVARWCETNEDVDNLVMNCVRFSNLTITKIISIVWPSKLVDCDRLMEAIAEIVEVRPKILHCRGFLILNQNIASREYKVEVISGAKESSGGHSTKYAFHTIDGRSNITVKLNVPSYLNHLVLKLHGVIGYHHTYSYYIEVSLDQTKWCRIIDYRRFACRSLQNLYFDEKIVRYIRIVGTYSTFSNSMFLDDFEAYCRSTIPKLKTGIICPDRNVATPNKNALVIQGSGSDVLLNGDSRNYNNHSGFCHHIIDEDNIVIQLAQPYMVSSMRLLLWDKDDRAYRYFIETSVNQREWEIAVDRRDQDCKSWQNLRFDERVVVFIRITGTHNTANNGFHCVHFECPSEENN